jgi:hypothetical protein
MRESLLGVIGLWCVAACSAGGGGESLGTTSPDDGAGGLIGGGGGNGGTTVNPGGSTGATSSGAGSAIGSGVRPGDPGTGPDGSCNSVVSKAEKTLGGKADIIFVVDNSGSMSEEASAIQKNLNAFSQQIVASGIDVHVILIASAPSGASAGACIDPTGIACLFVPGLTVAETGICMDPPLGLQGACPKQDDTNQAGGYVHVRQPVDSHNALEMIEKSFSAYQGLLRADAAKTFVVVTDDDANKNPTADAFTSWVNGQPLFQGATWRFSGLYCATGAGNCANAGTVYAGLVKATSGITGDMAQFSNGQIDAQFKTVFDSLAKAIVKDAVPVPCQWKIPPPPEGATLDPNAVNLHYTSGAGVDTAILSVDDESKCSPDFPGWHYDNNTAPTTVIACPQVCTTIQADDSAEIQVLFGCARERGPVK